MEFTTCYEAAVRTVVEIEIENSAKEDEGRVDLHFLDCVCVCSSFDRLRSDFKITVRTV